MEFEFDKEMDAILRKARGGGVAAEAVTPHVDADAIVAFAENALPDKTRQTLTRHLADCDRCRQSLSQVISMNSGAVATAASAVSRLAIADIPVPWYRKWLRSPGLAFGMGALVLGFAAILGYIALQQQKLGETSVAQITEQDQRSSGPSYSGEAANATSGNEIPAAAPEPQAASNTAANASAPGTVNKGILSENRKDAGEADETRQVEDLNVSGRSVSDLPMVSREPGATGGLSMKPGTKNDQQTDLAKLKTVDKEEATSERKQPIDDDRAGRDAVPPPSATSGPVRAAKPKKSAEKQELALSATQPTLTRSVGGKTFDQRGGIWYDLAYKGQGTTNIKRGSDDYRKLDSGLKNIAASLDGMIVVVWKEKAYRIQ